MSKLYQNKNKKKLQPPGEDLKPLQIDETIVSGLVNKQRENFKEELLNSMTNLIEQMESMGFLNVSSLFEDDDFNVEEFEEKMEKILGTDDLEVTPKTLNRYLKYLKAQIKLPCYLTGTEEFLWEEEYLYGSGSSKDYEKLKKTNPSYTDIFLLGKFQEKTDEMEGIIVDVKRVSDNRKFTIPLAELKASDEESPNYSLIEDYLTWFVNYL